MTQLLWSLLPLPVSSWLTGADSTGVSSAGMTAAIEKASMAGRVLDGRGGETGGCVWSDVEKRTRAVERLRCVRNGPACASHIDICEPYCYGLHERHSWWIRGEAFVATGFLVPARQDHRR
ncbi:hypothetical protein C8Q80DRAFT_917584 [Daedaleopsis nitida]|nr:hypothetical protein C8Q80DRAFT_917584 [Daedaleopsis nitida]